jgi:hypothetical protein
MNEFFIFSSACSLLVYRKAIDVHKNRYVDQSTWIEDSEINPYDSHLILKKGVKNIH